MSLDARTIEARMSLGEDTFWKFQEITLKEGIPNEPSRHDLANEIAAFANSGGGNLLFGVTDDRRVQDLSDEILDTLERMSLQICNELIKPGITIKADRIPLSQNRRVLVLSMKEGINVHRSPGGYFTRRGSTAQAMSGSELFRFGLGRGLDFHAGFDELLVHGTHFGTLEESLWSAFVDEAGKANPERGLQNLSFLTQDSHGNMRATLAGILLSTKTPEHWFPQAVITATCYRANDRSTGHLDADEFTGPLHSQVKAAMEFVARNIHTSSHNGKAGIEHPQYSDRALFEAIVNAIVHRDYSIMGSRIRLSIFSDRIEIDSPGSLPHGMTVESLPNLQMMRNEALAFALGRIPARGIIGSGDREFLMGRQGRGVSIIAEETKRLSGQEPRYMLIDGRLLLLAIPAAFPRA